MGVVNTSKPSGGQNPPKYEPPMCKTQVQKDSTLKWEKNVTLENPDKGIKETTTLSPTEVLP